jgi:hypothetical protein
VGALALSWLVVGRGGARTAPAPVPAADAPTAVPNADTAALRSHLGGGARCRDISGATARVVCTRAGVRVDARLVAASDVMKVYEADAGRPSAARRGRPACARGRPDERAWSRPEQPGVSVGRYRCRMERGRAAMWWTDEFGVVAHAVGGDGDLARLFAWWRAHPER